MANLLEYVINVRDRATSTMQRLGGAAVDATNRLGGVQNQSVLVASALRELGAPIDKLKQELDKLKQERGLIHQRDISQIRQFNTEIQNLEKQINKLESTTSQSKLSGWASEAFNQIPFAGLLTNPLVIAGSIAGAAIKKGIEQELQNTSFEVLLGSQKAAQNMVADLTKYGMETPYDKMALGENAKQLLGFQIAGEKVMPILKSIGDLAMGDKNKMDSLTLAFAQMSSTGKLNGQDLNQMINAGFNPLGEIALQTGKSIAVLKDEMAKGAITSQMIEEAFMSATSEGGKFYNMAEKQGKTLGGKWAQFMDSVSEKLLIVYKIIGPVTEKILELGGAALDASFNGLGWLVQGFSEGNPIIVSAIAILGTYTAGLILAASWLKIVAAYKFIATGALWAQVKAWWALNSAMYANPIGLWIGLAVAAVAAISWLIYKTEGLGEAWENTVNTAKSLWGGVTNFMLLKWEQFSGSIMNGVDQLIIAWSKFKALMGDSSAEDYIRVVEHRIDQRNKNVNQRNLDMINDLDNAWNSAKKITSSLSLNDKGLGDFFSDFQKKIGISAPSSIPGSTSVTSTIGGNTDKQGSATAIATGGTKHNYITINLTDLIGVLNINKSGFKESVDEMQEQSTDALLRLLASAASAGN